jgi:hypothetical protein
VAQRIQVLRFGNLIQQLSLRLTASRSRLPVTNHCYCGGLDELDEAGSREGSSR